MLVLICLTRKNDQKFVCPLIFKTAVFLINLLSFGARQRRAAALVWRAGRAAETNDLISWSGLQLLP